MPTRKQRRREAKGRRHEYETVWLDSEGNELEQPPEDVAVSTRQRRDNGKPPARAQQQRRGGPARVPQPPSWQRAAKRAGMLGAVIFVLFYILGSKGGGHNLGAAVGLAALYTALFIPFTYFIDRFAYTRYQRRAAQQGGKSQPRKR